MGVKNLWKLLEPYGAAESVKGKRLAVDTSIWMHQLCHVADPYLQYVITKRIIKLLCNQITPIFVFDGGVPALKRRTVHRRRENILRLAEERCHVCGAAAPTCGHRRQPGRHTRDTIDAVVLERIRSHDYNWGELSEEHEGDSDLSEYDRAAPDGGHGPSVGVGSMRGQHGVTARDAGAHDASGGDGESPSVNPISLITENSFGSLPRTQRLRKLVDMRQYRRLPMELETSSSSAFSLSHIENVKKRNMVRRLIDEINSDGQRRVQSNWKRHIQYEKEPVLKMHTRYEAGNYAAAAGSSAEEAEGDLPALFSTESPAGRLPGQCASAEPKHGMGSKADLFKKYEHLAQHGNSPSDCLRDVHGFTYKISRRQPCPAAGEANLQPRQDDPLEWMHSMANREEGPGLRSLDYQACRAPADYGPRDQRSLTTAESEAASLQDQLVNDLTPLDGGILKIHAVIKTILAIFNICFIDSPEEADSQCAFLYKSSIVDGVITEDNDLILHGATVYRNFFSRSRPVAVYTFESISRGLSLTQTGLIKLSFLLGSDYTPGVYGIGIKKALARVESVTADEIAGIERVYTQPNISRISGFQNGSVNTKALAHYLGQGSLPREKIDELLSYVSMIKPAC